MSRALRIELSVKNLTLLALALLTLAAGVTFAVLRVGSPFAQSSNRMQTASEGEHAKHNGERSNHGEEKHAPGEPGTGEHEKNHVQLSPEALKNAAIELATAGPAEVNVTLSLPGEVSLNLDAVAHVTPRVSGTAREVLKRVGETVKKGELLATLESRDLAEAQREFLASKERLSLAEATFARAEQLQKENISAEKDFLQAKQSLAEARIEHRSAAQKLQAIGGGRSGSGYALVAPFAGTIIERHVTIGEVLTESTRAFTIADLSTIWVNVMVYAKDLSLVRVGQNAEVRAEGIADPAHGTIAYLGQVVGEQTRSANARVVLKEPGIAWRPGLFATAEVVVDRATSQVVISDAAIQTVEGKDVVFVQEGDAFAVHRVRLGRKGRGKDPEQGSVVEVLDGLKAGDRFVSKNSFILKAELGKSEAGHDH